MTIEKWLKKTEQSNITWIIKSNGNLIAKLDQIYKIKAMVQIWEKYKDYHIVAFDENSRFKHNKENEPVFEVTIYLDKKGD